MTPSRDQYAGCLIGQALGDAMGFIVEGQEPTVCRNFVETTVRPGRIERARRGQFDFGQYSDDTQLARELLRSFVTWDGVFDPEDYAGRIARAFQYQQIVGRGRSTEEAAERLAAGVTWTESGTPAPSAGNGSAMRAGPIGLMFPDDPVSMVRAAFDQGRCTHADPRCSAGAVAIAGAVALALKGQGDDPRAFLNQLALWAGTYDKTLADGLLRLRDWIGIPPDQAAAYIARVGRAPEDRDMWVGISPFVVPSVLWALYAYLRTPTDYLSVVCTAISGGGDTDTTAAMAGAVAGARLGLTTLPYEEATKLTDQGEWGLDALIELAHHTHQLVWEGGA
jgi:ADP-ribosylglycohydrolase